MEGVYGCDDSEAWVWVELGGGEWYEGMIEEVYAVE